MYVKFVLHFSGVFFTCIILFFCTLMMSPAFAPLSVTFFQLPSRTFFSSCQVGQYRLETLNRRVSALDIASISFSLEQCRIHYFLS